MKKFLGMIVAVMLCVCMLVPTAVAADESITDLLEGVDLGGLTADDLETILGDLDLEDIDLEAIVDSFEGDDGVSVDQIEGVLKDMNSVQASNSGDGTSSNSFDMPVIIRSNSDESVEYFRTEVSTSSEKQHYSIEFTAPATDSDTSIVFQMGGYDSTNTTLSNIKLTKVS